MVGSIRVHSVRVYYGTHRQAMKALDIPIREQFWMGETFLAWGDDSSIEP